MTAQSLIHLLALVPPETPVYLQEIIDSTRFNITPVDGLEFGCHPPTSSYHNSPLGAEDFHQDISDKTKCDGVLII